MKEYNHKKIEKKWQKEWEKKKIYFASDISKKEKFYGLMEFPYPSGDGLHVGHVRGYTAMDIIARKKRLEGKNVLFPIGWDAFGLPTENYAIKTGKQPKVITKKNTDNFKKQFNSLGISFDWSREINTTDPSYYKWTQWIFLQFLKKGLAYKAKSEINWCSSCKIGLANEEVVDGKCERCGTETIKKEKEQWMLAITKYADRLDSDLDLVDFPERVKSLQRNWIGKSEGSEIEFKIIHPSPALPEGKGDNTRGYFTTDVKTWRLLQDQVLEMRKNSTEAEEKLWQILRKDKDNHFRRQHIINRFIADFVCLSKKLIIEVDGDIHDFQREKDEERTNILNSFGFKVIRFKNTEVLKDINSVVKEINKTLENPSLWEGQGWAINTLGGIKVFTTRADTLFGATYVVLAPENILVQSILDKCENKKEVEDYIKKVKNKSDLERTENKEKTGVELKGIKAINPANNQEISIWIADYVLVGYGTGAVMAVPAHDERDLEFAKKYNLPIKNVIEPIFTRDLNPNAPIEERETISAIVKHWREEKYLCLKWKKVDWITFVTGGIEKGQTPEEAARAEILEETGYFNLDIVEVLPKSHSKFYHVPKKVNRFGHFNDFYFKLKNGEQKEITEEEKGNHEILWLSKEEVEKALTSEGEKNSFKILNGDIFAYTGEGILANSDKFNGLESMEAKKKITEFVGGKIVTKYKLRDWVFSRQRYWGEPIPLINCAKCGLVPVPEKNLPVKLPEVKSYKPTDNGESPLAIISKWVNTKCPKCGGRAKRETDTMPNWAGSSWYYLRYIDSKNKKEFGSMNKLKYWLTAPIPSTFQEKGKKGKALPFGEGLGGVDHYNGGMEHTTLHLLYSRFWHKFLYDLKLVPTIEPYKKRTSHGMILGEGGVKMSKSLGNVVNPDDIVALYGADTLRVYEMFVGPFEDTAVWNTESIIGSRRFIEKVWRIAQKIINQPTPNPFPRKGNNASEKALPFGEGLGGVKLLHKTIKKVGEDIDAMHFNTAISAMMILATEMEKTENIDVKDFEKFLQILAPFAPHIAEEIWQNLRTVLKRVSPRTVLEKSIHLSIWPKYDENLIKDDEVKIGVQVNGKVRAEILIGVEESEEKIKEKALKNEAILKYTQDKEIKKVIYIKNRLINIVL